MNSNLELWDQVCETDPGTTKAVDFGRKFTAIDAYSQIHKATELWGPYGKLWGLYDIHHSYDVPELCIVTSVFKYPDGEFPISTGIIYLNKGKVDKDFPKKAETDLITKALSRLGFNADVFLGKFDDHPYVESLIQKFGEKKEKEAQQKQVDILTLDAIKILNKVKDDDPNSIIAFGEFWTPLDQEMQMAINGNKEAYPEKTKSKYNGLIKSTISAYNKIVNEYVEGIRGAYGKNDCVYVTHLTQEIRENKILKVLVFRRLTDNEKKFVADCKLNSTRTVKENEAESA